MSAIITKYYNQVFKPLVSVNGFGKKRTLFHRLIDNRILQTLCMQKGRFGYSFTLNIGVFPMCIGFSDEMQLKVGTFNIGMFVVR